MGPLVRFDDVRSGSAFSLHGFRKAVVAATIDEVVPVLEQVEQAVAAGLWAGGFVVYEAAPAFDPSLTTHDPTGSSLPLAWFGLFEHRRTLPPLEPRRMRPAPYSVSSWTPSISRKQYEEAFGIVRDHIAAGDTYQVNQTFRLHAAFAGDPLELYRDLVLSQRGAHAAYLDIGGHQVVSASPELFFRRDGGVLSTKPMKGTIGRGRWPAEDDQQAARLAASKKDQAENLMIVDMLRNDLGRLAEFGTVAVQRLHELERFETVWQLTSTITGNVPESVGFVDVMTALFPCGSVTGAPKARTMQIIADVEDSPRGVYCGTIGWLAPPGERCPSAQFNVAIRTVAVDAAEGVAEFGVGGGITWDSKPAGEYDEARAKAQVLVQRRPDFDLLETMGYDTGAGIAWLDRHLARMELSARYFGFAWDEGAVRRAVESAISGLGEGRWRIRLTLDRAGRPEAAASLLEPPVQDPVALAVDDEPVSSRNVFLFHKTTYRREYEQAAARHPEAADVVMINERGEATETTIANLAVLLDGQWWTPPLDAGCLPGIYRQVLLEDGAIRERPIEIDDLYGADEIAVLNSVRLWRPARLLGPVGATASTPAVGGGAGTRAHRFAQ